MQSELSKQCGILAKLRHYVPRNQVFSYYNSNVTPLNQYGALVYGCCTYSALLPIYLLQKKYLKVIYFRKKGDHCDDIFMRHSLLTIYELHIYELIKFVLKSINGLHQQYFCNNLFQFKSNDRKTRSGMVNLPKEPFCKKKLERNSICFRGAKLYNKLKIMQIFPVSL